MQPVHGEFHKAQDIKIVVFTNAVFNIDFLLTQSREVSWLHDHELEIGVGVAHAAAYVSCSMLMLQE